MDALVGYTGFVGSNLYAQRAFPAVYNSKNIAQSYGTRPDLLIYAGVRAEKYLAAHALEQDLAQIRQAQENIARIVPRRLVLISTIDVLGPTAGKDETAPAEATHPYGAHRLALEAWTRAYAPDALIIRLPALFGKGLKKNFLYDCLHPVPRLLTAEKLAQLSELRPELCDFYRPRGDGFCALRPLAAGEEAQAETLLKEAGFSALYFTDSRSTFQFYPLSRLWGDIQTCLEAGLTLFHPATEPVSAGEVYRFLTGTEFRNELPSSPAAYDYRTRHAALFGGTGGYLLDKTQVLREVKRFVEGNQG